MRITKACLLAAALLANCANAEEAITLTSVVKMFQERDLPAIQTLRPQAVEALSLIERNEAAVAAAKSLSIKKYIGAIGADTIQKHFTKPPAQDSPEEAECRKQWGINMRAAELLRDMAEKRVINSPEVVPYLIDGLDHPHRSLVGQPCFYALKYLTYHESGDAYWGRGVRDEARHREIVSWWKTWWKANKDKHPILDQDIEARSKTTILALARAIETKIKPAYPGWTEFSVPEQLPLHGPPSPLFAIEFNPRLLANIAPEGLDRAHLPWLCLTCEVATSDLPEPAGWGRPTRPSPLKDLQPYLRQVYCREIAGSDIRVVVRAASEDDSLLKALERVLNEETGTQPPSPAAVAARAAPEK